MWLKKKKKKEEKKAKAKQVGGGNNSYIQHAQDGSIVKTKVKEVLGVIRDTK